MYYGSLCTEVYDLTKGFASDEEVSFYTSIFSPRDKLLEPMCGSGRLLIPLLKEGLDVEGLDNSEDMLASCKRRANEFGITPVLYYGSIRKLNLPISYNGIIISFGSFQLIHPREEACKVLEILNHHLLPKGKLVMDLFVPWESLYENAEESKSDSEYKTFDGESIKLSWHNKVNKYEQYFISECTYTKLLHGTLIKEEKEEYTINWYYLYEMELLLEKHGFTNIAVKGRFMNGQHQMTFIAEKA
ncbi:MAG: class I SAM-dependent methyltransferase [Sphingobacteriia bacterium]|nr:class I SAM-dependent methyltransferase [Sphingobacteriia bacterium]